MNQANKSKPTLGAYVVGAYLFSVPAFAYSESLGLLVVPQLAGALLVAFAIVDIIERRRIAIPKEIGLYGLLGLWAVATFIFGADSSGWRALGTLIKVVVATLACAQLIKREEDFLLAMKIFIFSILLVYYQNMGELRYLRIADNITAEDRFAGTLSNANTAAIFSLAVIWASLIVLLHLKRGLLARAFYLIPIGISLLIIYYSGSKKGLIGIALFALFLTRLLYIREKRSFYRKSVIIVASILMIILVSLFIYTSPFFRRIEEFYSGRSDSDIKRIELAGEAIKVWRMNWKTFFMGVGHDNFRLFSYYQDYSHSTPFELLANNGLIGFLLFIGFLFLFFQRFLFLYRHASDGQLAAIFFASLIFLFVYSFFMVAAVLHDSRELMPILGCAAAYGQHHLRKLFRDRSHDLQNSVL